MRWTMVTFLMVILSVFVGSTVGYLAGVDMEILRFRIFDKDKAAGGAGCDTDHWIGRYNPCDYVFFVKNCTQGIQSGPEICSSRIERYYGPEDTDDVIFGELARGPVTSFLIDNAQATRMNFVRIEVYDQDDGFSSDDAIGVYQLRMTPESIEARGQAFSGVREQAIIIPAHSELTVRYRAYCIDQDCSNLVGAVSFDPRQGGVPPLPGQRLTQLAPAEAWTLGRNNKAASWTGQLLSPGSQRLELPAAAGYNKQLAEHGAPPSDAFGAQHQPQPNQTGQLVRPPAGGYAGQIPVIPVIPVLPPQQQQQRVSSLMGIHCVNGRCVSDVQPRPPAGLASNDIHQLQASVDERVDTEQHRPAKEQDVHVDVHQTDSENPDGHSTFDLHEPSSADLHEAPQVETSPDLHKSSVDVHVQDTDGHSADIHTAVDPHQDAEHAEPGHVEEPQHKASDVEQHEAVDGGGGASPQIPGGIHGEDFVYSPQAQSYLPPSINQTEAGGEHVGQLEHGG